MDPIWVEARLDPPSFDRTLITKDFLPPIFEVEQVQLRSSVSGDIRTEFTNENIKLIIDEIDGIVGQISNLSQKRVDFAKRELQPFLYLPRGPFKMWSALKLANIDAIYNITGLPASILNVSHHVPYRYISLNGGPGAWVEYLQYRGFYGKGLGITPITKPWDFSRISRNFLTSFVGNAGHGNIITEGEEFIERVGDIKSDLVMASNEIFTGYSEIDLAPILIMETYIGLKLLSPNKNMIVRISRMTTNLMFQLVVLWFMAFERVTLFTPVTSYMGSSDQYLMGFKRHERIDNVLEILSDATKFINENGITPSNLFTGTVNEVIYNRLGKWNIDRLNMQLNFLKNVHMRASGEHMELARFYLPKVFVLMNITIGASETINQFKKVEMN